MSIAPTPAFLRGKSAIRSGSLPENSRRSPSVGLGRHRCAVALHPEADAPSTPGSRPASAVAWRRRAMPASSRGRVSSRCWLLLPLDSRPRQPARRGAASSSLRHRPRSATGCWIGLGSSTMPSNFTYLPANRLGLGPQHAEGVDVFVGDLAAVGEGRRDDGIELGLEPAPPMPTTSRPPLSTSSVASILAASTAGRCGTTSTAATSRMREVLAAIQAMPMSCSCRSSGASS